MTAPAIVAIGGGHGLATVLEGLAGRCGSLVGVVSVADDGGSSGRLRRDLSIIAPGDLRRCLAALTPDDLMAGALEHRFGRGALRGHPAGNVLLAALLELEDDPVRVLDTLASMLGARGRVLPATTGEVDLLATTDRGTVKGQVAVSESGAITAIRHVPPDPSVPEVVVEAIESADVVVLGPGSLYTSVLAPVVPGLAAAIGRRAGPLVYVANLATEPGETEGYDLAAHLEAVRRHGLEPDVVLCHESVVVPVDDTVTIRIGCLVAGSEPAHDARLLGDAILACAGRVTSDAEAAS